MNTLSVVWAALTLGLGAAAAAVQTAGRSGYGALKMAAASGYLAFALQQGALESAYGRAVLGALLLSWLGDLLLIGEARTSFLAGLGSFLVAHLAYAAAFGIRGVALTPMVAGALGMAVLAWLILRWLERAELRDRMRLPVAAYLAAIGVMVALAIGTRVPLIAAGAVAFAASDVLVARQRFVVQAAINRRVGLPLYFLAQLLLAASI